MRTALNNKSPREAGFHMPAEWEPHAATWLAWPHYHRDWPGKMTAVHWAYGEMIRKLAPAEHVYLLITAPRHEAQARRVLTALGVKPGALTFLPYSTDRAWARDFGPIFVRRPNPPHAVAIVNFRFNAWARYPNWRRDDQIARLAARRLGCRLFQPILDGRTIVLEGGSIDVNGRGTLLTTEECLLDQVTQARNPGVDRQTLERVLRDCLGATRVGWLGRGIKGDDTHGHVDDFCRFVSADTIVLCQETNPRDVNYHALEENRERLADLRLENGSRPQVARLPMPAPLHFNGHRLPASYANFYIGNAAVLVPTFNDPQDRRALGILADFFPDRPVVGIHAADLVVGRGGVHCLTQQQPAVHARARKHRAAQA